jgi:hypothetical protein
MTWELGAKAVVASLSVSHGDVWCRTVDATTSTEHLTLLPG